ncbi:MAG: signal recognition particle-docking protein FtsY [Deltaproteobacteria bacterium]|nr:signal recognition particle-docking protein FtsY [Deltaproteobacteria bacterium]
MIERITYLLETARALAAAHPQEAGLASAGAFLILILLVVLVRRGRGSRTPAPESASAKDTEALLRSSEAPQPVAMPEPKAVEPETVEPEAVEPGLLEPEPPEPAESFFQSLRRGLARTQDAFVGRLDSIFAGREKLDEEAFEEIEEVLYTADLGVATATRLMEALRDRAAKGGGAQALRDALKTSVEEILSADGKAFPEGPESGPRVVMFVGVNGVGKTTTVGKVGAQYVSEGKRVILAAADTFRAAAIEQLEIWGERIGAQVIKQAASSDPSAVAFDAAAAARSRGVDVLLVDTAGRLHTKANLMEELKKMKRILGRELPGAPHEVILVLDATTGQNALSQARQFNEAVGVTGIALTKLDGTAKGGIVIAVHEELGLPIRYIGVGEKVNDLRPFDAHAFVEALFTRA